MQRHPVGLLVVEQESLVVGAENQPVLGSEAVDDVTLGHDGFHGVGSPQYLAAHIVPRIPMGIFGYLEEVSHLLLTEERELRVHRRPDPDPVLELTRDKVCHCCAWGTPPWQSTRWCHGVQLERPFGQRRIGNTSHSAPSQ